MNNKSKLAFIIDYCALLVCYFILSMLVLGSFIYNLILQIALSIVLSIVINFIVNKIYYAVTKKKKLKFSIQNKINDIITTLQNSDPIKLHNFFYNAMSKKYKCEKNDTYNSFFCNINGLNVLFYFNFYYVIKISDIIDLIYSYNKAHQIFIFSKDIDGSVKSYTKNIKKIKLFDAEKTYNLLKFLNTFPKITEKSKNHNYKQIIKNTFVKSNAKIFIKLAILFAISSLLLSFSIYYRIFASLMIVFTILCFILPQESNSQKEKMFFEQ